MVGLAPARRQRLRGLRDALGGTRLELTFLAGEQTSSTLLLPSAWGGEEQLWRHLEGLQVSNGRLEPAGADPARRVIHHQPQAKLTVRYRVRSGYVGEPSASSHGNPYRPIIRPAWVQVLGHALFVRVEGDERSSQLSLKSWPVGWQVVSNALGGALDEQALGSSVLMAGSEVRVVSRPLTSGTLRVALRGEFTFADADLANMAQLVIDAQRAFWGHDVKGDFLVTLVPLSGAPGSNSLGGTGLTNAFALYATPSIELARFRRLLAHEHLHSWVPMRLGRLPEGPDDASDAWLGVHRFLRLAHAGSRRCVVAG